MLLEGRDLFRVAGGDGALPAPRLRFGSLGSRVERLQDALKRRGFYEGIVDGDFRGRTLRAVLAYQTAQFGPQADDGIVGPITATALGITGGTRSRAVGLGATGNGAPRGRSRSRT